MTIPDIKEREEALDPERSFIIEAPAGSGKTELLIRRYLRLLATVQRPEDILAITFTRKAAGEMHSRVMDALRDADKGAAPEEPYKLQTYELSNTALERDKEMSWGILENPSRLRVQTIDSLSARIVSRMPVLTGLGARPALVEEPAEIYVEAARKTIEKVEEEGRDGECVREALRHLDNYVPKLTERLVAMLKKRDQWLRLIGVGPAPLEDKTLRAKLEAPVKAIVEGALHVVSPLFDEAVSKQLVKSAVFAAGVLLRAGKMSPVTKLADLTELPGTRVENLEKWRVVAAFLMTKEGEWRSPTGVNKNIGFPADKEYQGEKDDFKALLDDLEGRDDLKAALGALAILPNARYDEEEWSILAALLHLLPVAAAELTAIFAAQGSLDFQSLTMAASSALVLDDQPSDLLLSIDMHLKHLLVDEFQDTSRSHYELIETLVSGFEPGDGRTLFIVGDPMQSIYLFRDADVGLFLKAAQEGMASLELKRIKLTSNFRSLPGIVDWVNETFAPAFPEVEKISGGAVSYTHSFGAVEDERAADINMNIYPSRDDAREATDIADSIELIRKNNSVQESIAILVRSRPHLPGIIDELKSRHLDFRTTKLDPLIECAVVQDLMSLLRALEHPFDRVAWLSLLRAPWCGLSLKDIHSLASYDLNGPLYLLMRDEEIMATLTPDGRERLGRLEEIIKKALALKGRVGIRRLLDSLWVELGGPATLREPGEMDNAESFFDLVDKFFDSGLPFSLCALEARVGKLFAIHNGLTENPIEIMTIHSAKGLEFDHVFLPGLGKWSRPEDNELLAWIEKDGDMLLAPVEGMEFRDKSSLYSYIRLLKAEKLSFEHTRLFYVAATRARLSLSLYGHAKSIIGEPKSIIGEGEERALAVDSRSLLSIIEGSLDISMLSEVDDESAENLLNEAGDGVAPIYLRRHCGQWKLPEPVADLERRETGRIAEIMEDRDAKPSFDWAGEERKHVGTVVHRYFCRVVRDGLDSWDIKKARGEFVRMRAMLRGLGLSKEKAEINAKESVEILCKALSDKEGRFVLSPHSEGEAEYQLTGIKGGVIKEVKIDRTFVDSENVRWIVDYKTSKHKGKIDDFLEEEKIRYAPQLNKYKEMFASFDDSREIKCILYYPEFSKYVLL